MAQARHIAEAPDQGFNIVTDGNTGTGTPFTDAKMPPMMMFPLTFSTTLTSDDALWAKVGMSAPVVVSNLDATQTFTLTVNQPPAITSVDHVTFTVGTLGTFTVTTSGFPAPASGRVSAQR